jgi:hypothetical protein
VIALLIIFAPLVALIVWGVVYDLKRRRRRAPLTNHNPEAELRRNHQQSTDISYKAAGGIPDITDVFGH